MDGNEHVKFPITHVFGILTPVRPPFSSHFYAGTLHILPWTVPNSLLFAQLAKASTAPFGSPHCLALQPAYCWSGGWKEKAEWADAQRHGSSSRVIIKVWLPMMMTNKHHAGGMRESSLFFSSFVLYPWYHPLCFQFFCCWRRWRFWLSYKYLTSLPPLVRLWALPPAGCFFFLSSLVCMSDLNWCTFCDSAINVFSVYIIHDLFRLSFF